MEWGATVGLAEMHLSVASGERHDGTASTGANWTGGNTLVIASNNILKVIEWWVFKDFGGLSTEKFAVRLGQNTGGEDIIHGCVVDGGTSPHATASGFIDDRPNKNFHNNIILNLTGATGGRGMVNVYAEVDYRHNTVYNCRIGIQGVDVATDSLALANLSFDCTTSDFTGTFHADSTDNTSSDLTAPGSDSVTSATASDYFVSLTSGSEDLKQKAGAPSEDDAADLGTTPTHINDDIIGRDRDAEGDTWDRGAHELPPAVSLSPQLTLLGVGA